MLIKFEKYEACGNDFIFPNSDVFQALKNDVKRLAKLCDRRFGVGADGVIWISDSMGHLAFNMIYFNADGNPGSFCGNGSRCAILHANRFGLVEKNKDFSFFADHGLHFGLITNETIRVSLTAEQYPRVFKTDFIINTGSPHYVRFVENPDAIDVVKEGRHIRYSEPFKKEGINVNFISVQENNKLNIRTYERGVEDETLACGTGVTAAALVYAFVNNIPSGCIQVEARGGSLQVEFSTTETGFKDVELYGGARHVFSGAIEL